MIFPDITLNKWFEKHPQLAVSDLKCLCGKPINPEKPFITKEYFGVLSQQCIFCESPATSIRIHKNRSMQALQTAGLNLILAALDTEV